MCGEKVRPELRQELPRGSPPHVRGKVGQLENHQMVVGITPACAGKSFEEHGFVIGVWDHPRMCGEKFR